MKAIEITEDSNTTGEKQPFTINDLLIDNHDFLDKCPFWNIRTWDIFEEQCPDNYATSFEYLDVHGSDLVYKSSEGITYVIFNDTIISIILTDDTYFVHKGFKIGDLIDENLMAKYRFLKYDLETSKEEYISLMENVELGPSSMFEYDSIYYVTSFISEQDNQRFMETFLENNDLQSAVFDFFKPNTIQLSLFVKNEVIIGICIEI